MVLSLLVTLNIDSLNGSFMVGRRISVSPKPSFCPTLGMGPIAGFYSIKKAQSFRSGRKGTDSQFTRPRAEIGDKNGVSSPAPGKRRKLIQPQKLSVCCQI